MYVIKLKCTGVIQGSFCGKYKERSEKEHVTTDPMRPQDSTSPKDFGMHATMYFSHFSQTLNFVTLSLIFIK